MSEVDTYLRKISTGTQCITHTKFTDPSFISYYVLAYGDTVLNKVQSPRPYET